MTSLFTQLNLEWASRYARHGSRQLTRWATLELALAGPHSFGELIASVRTLTSGEADPILVALARIAAHDDTAGRVLLQCLIPGLRNLARRTHHNRPASIEPDEWASVVIAHAWRRIRRYPARRTQHVAANLLLDTLHDSTNHLRRHRQPIQIPDEHLSLPAHQHHHQTEQIPTEPNSGDELHRLLQDALRNGLLSREDFEVIFATRIAGVAINELAARRGKHPGTLRRQRATAETALRHAA